MSEPLTDHSHRGTAPTGLGSPAMPRHIGRQFGLNSKHAPNLLQVAVDPFQCQTILFIKWLGAVGIQDRKNVFRIVIVFVNQRRQLGSKTDA